MKTVTIIPNKTTGEYITKFEKSSKDFSFMKVQGTVRIHNGPYVHQRTVFAQIKAKYSILEEMLEESKPTLKLPGQIWIREYLESEIPANVLMEFISADIIQNQPDKFDEILSGYEKTTRGKDSLNFMYHDEKIYEFTCYDSNPDKQLVHILQPHSNGQEIKDWLEANPREAKLPVTNEEEFEKPNAKELAKQMKKSAIAQ